jgi:hypothetical protein
MPTPSWQAPELTPEDLLTTASHCANALSAELARDWSALAFDMEWSCRRTIDHIIDVMFIYAIHLASRATRFTTPLRNGDPERSPAELLEALPVAAAVLAEVARAAPPEARGFHNAGLTDRTGFLAMGCEEILLHTDDILRAFEVELTPPAGLPEQIVARIFPWAPADVPAWAALRWSAGRIALPDRPRLEALWGWHPAPLSEWDGEIRRRKTPPAWR